MWIFPPLRKFHSSLILNFNIFIDVLAHTVPLGRGVGRGGEGVQHFFLGNILICELHFLCERVG